MDYEVCVVNKPKVLKNLSEAIKKLGPDNLFSYIEKVEQPFLDSFKEQSDRAVSIVSVCLLDTLLEKLIRSSFVKGKGVNRLFSSDHILQTFSSKIQIAFFSGLIAEPIYKDLMKIGNIRNKFAHDITANLNFSEQSVSDRINSCELRPNDIDEIYDKQIHPTNLNRLKYNCIVTNLITFICIAEQCLSTRNLPHPVEYFNLDELDYERFRLPKEEIIRIFSQKRSNT